jgi:hypothetical protein
MDIQTIQFNSSSIQLINIQEKDYSKTRALTMQTFYVDGQTINTDFLHNTDQLSQ